MRCARLAAGRYGWVAAVVAGILLTTAPVHAQRKRDNGEFTTPPLAPQDRTRLQQLREGQAAPSEADKEVLDRAARFFVYRLTDPKFQFPPPGATGKQNMYELVQEVFQHFPDLKKLSSDPTKADNQRKYIKEFSTRMAGYVLKLLDSPDMIARVNGVLLLARLGESGEEALADSMCKILEDKNQGDAVKVHALRGLRNIFDNPHEDAFKGDAGEERLVHCLRTLTDFLNNRKLAAGATEPEREGFRYVRREAVRALAAARVPVIEKRRIKVSIPSLSLMQVVAGAGLEPPPSLTERMEAAAGLCRMRTKNANRYQPEVAAYYIGRVVVDFASQYDRDRSGQPALGYKYYAYLLDEALVELKNQTGGKIQYVNELINRARPVLKAIMTDGAPAQLPLKDWLDAKSWEGKELFKGDAETSVKGAVLKETAPPAPAK